MGVIRSEFVQLKLGQGTLDKRHWTLDKGRWTRVAGQKTLDIGQ